MTYRDDVTTDRPRVLSFGGGVQSSALVALLGRGDYPGAAPHEVWFCDPRGERPQTYTWIEQTIRPYLARLGVPFLVLERHESPSRGADLMESYRRRAAFPLKANRVCTIEWKVRVAERECKRRGWHLSGGVEKHLGISLDELHRARSASGTAWEHLRYPLIERRLFRADCVALCEETFGAVPVKSGCWFCKYQREPEWRAVWDARADGRWAELVQWEREVIARRGMGAIFFEGTGRTLAEWAEQWEMGRQLPLFADSGAGACDGGYCMV